MPNFSVMNWLTRFPKSEQHFSSLSDVARPLSYKTKTTYFFKNKTAFFKDHHIINPRPLA